MKEEKIYELDKKFIANTYNRFEVAFKEGEGSILKDFNGKSYIDFGSGIAVSAFGISDPIWRKAIIKQLKTLSHTSNLYYTEPQVKLAQLLCKKTGFKKVFFANSGAEANEGAIKCARKYSHDKYGDDRYEIITLNNSFHGRTITTLAATAQDVFHKNFMPFTEGFVYASANDINDVKSKISSKTCAIMFEVIQGEGGIYELEADFMHEIQKLCKSKDLLMIIDEVQTGNGRTGYLYSYMKYDLKPNIVTTAKGIAGGLPMGAVMFDSKCADVLGKGDHATTFGGNPIVAAGAISIINRLTPELMAEVLEKEKIIRDELKNVKGVLDISGSGLMLGIKVEKPARDIVDACLKKGLVLLTAKDKIRLLPALNIKKEDLVKGLDILKEVIAK